MRIHRLIVLVFFSTAVLIAAQEAPRAWNDEALSDWATPVAGLNQHPTHMPEGEYYALPVENLRTYPVYYPGREPAGYWEMLQHVGPKPLIEPERLKTEADWIEAGRRVFDELDHIPLRTFDPMFIAAVRDAKTFEAAKARPLPDGAVFGARWAPTATRVALSFSNCANCHLLYRSDGTRVPGAPTFAGDYRISPGGVALAARACGIADIICTMDRWPASKRCLIRIESRTRMCLGAGVRPVQRLARSKDTNSV
jgi:hypothetical protein